VRVQAETDRDYWRGVLLAGGFTAIPRWTLDPVEGVDEYEVTIADDLVATLRQLADELEISLISIVLAAHAKVLAALTGEQKVTTGYVAVGGAQSLPCRLLAEADSWRTLLLHCHRVESELLAHKDFPVDDLRRELGLTEPSFETVLDATGTGRGLAEDTVIGVGLSQHGGQLRLRYRTDVLDADYAARMAGYHLTALALIVADPGADPGQRSLLAAEELRFQLEGLAGPLKELPDCRFHELFEQEVRAHPDVVAAVQGDRHWTYRKLNARANRLGRALALSFR